MPISQDVPQHLVVGARTGFLRAVKDQNPLWNRVAMVHNMGAKSVDLVDLGAAPMPVESRNGSTLQQFVERSLTVTPKSWDLTVGLAYDDLQDDQTNSLERRIRGAGANFNLHLNKLVFETLNGGDGTTYGLCYDGQEFFDNDHVDKGAKYTTNQDNEHVLTLSLDNFETVKVAMSTVRDDQGEYMALMPNLLIVPPALERTAAQITGNPDAYDTGNREANPYAGQIQQIVVPWVDSTAWFLIAANENVKPLIVVLREEPKLQSAWFDPNMGARGGMYLFKFYARYSVAFGDWRLAAQGNT